MAKTRKAKTENVLAPVRPNAGLEAAFQANLDAMIDEMQSSLTWWITAGYRANTPEMAQDASPAMEMRLLMKRLARRWQKRFDDAAPELAKYYAMKMADRADGALMATLKKAGFAIEFKLTPEANDILQATIGEQTELIRNIASHHLAGIQGAVMRSVAAGGDLHSLSKELHERYGITRRRAALIARDQNRKATANIQRARFQELGVKEAIWIHSHGGRKPRPSHLANDGKRFDVEKGWYDPDAKCYCWPGTLINCFPGDMEIGLETKPVRLWRTLFNGPMIDIKVGADLLSGTFNHPILTSRGWVALGEINCGDKVVCMVSDNVNVIDNNEHHPKTTFEDFFKSLSVRFANVSRESGCFNFYGDVPDHDVDEIIIVDDELGGWTKSGIIEDIEDFFFPEPDPSYLGAGNSRADHVLTTSGPCARSGSNFLLGGLHGETGKSSIGSIPHNSGPDQHVSYGTRSVSRSPDMGGDSGRADAGLVELDDFGGKGVPISATVDDDTEMPNLFAEFVRIAADRGSRIFEFGSISYEFRSVIDKNVRDFSGHIYTMQTLTGYYSVGGASVQAKNCKCVMRPVIPGF